MNRRVSIAIWITTSSAVVWMTLNLTSVPLHAQESLTGEEFVAIVADASSPGDVELSDITITGETNFRGLERIDRPIRCVNCVFTGRFQARDITFGAIVEFLQSTFEDDVDLRGALFDRSAVFDGSEFRESIDLGSTRFGDLGSFADARFMDAARFDRTVFASRVVFTSSNPVVDRSNNKCDVSQSAFFGPASFSGASFEDRVDFRRRCFQDLTSFTNTSFAAPVDYTLASFFGETDFEQVVFAAGADLRVTDFYNRASFEEATTAELVDFSGATFRQRTAFNGFGGSGVLALDAIKTPGEDLDVLFEMNDLSVSFLVFEPERIDLVGGPAVQQEVLERVAATAKVQGDISLANDAQYQLLALKSRDLSGVATVLDWLFYRTIAGYLVRPLHPLWTLAILLTIAATVRVIRSQTKRHSRQTVSESDTDKAPSRARSEGAVLMGADVFAGYAAALSTAWSPRSGQSVPQGEDGASVPIRTYLVALLRFLEWLAYRILIALIVIGVANSIPVVHELIDAIF